MRVEQNKRSVNVVKKKKIKEKKEKEKEGLWVLEGLEDFFFLALGRRNKATSNLQC